MRGEGEIVNGERREKLEKHKEKKKGKTFPRVCYFRDEVLFRKLLYVLREEEEGKVGTAMVYIYMIYIGSSTDCRLFAKHSELVPLPKHVRLC